MKMKEQIVPEMKEITIIFFQFKREQTSDLAKGINNFATFKDGDIDLHCASFCTATIQYNSLNQNKMNQLVRKNKINNKQNVSLMF